MRKFKAAKRAGRLGSVFSCTRCASVQRVFKTVVCGNRYLSSYAVDACRNGKGLHVNCHLFLSDFNESNKYFRRFSVNFSVVTFYESR